MGDDIHTCIHTDVEKGGVCVEVRRVRQNDAGGEQVRTYILCVNMEKLYFSSVVPLSLHCVFRYFIQYVCT